MVLLDYRRILYLLSKDYNYNKTMKLKDVKDKWKNYFSNATQIISMRKPLRNGLMPRKPKTFRGDEACLMKILPNFWTWK